MFDHVVIRVADRGASERFYRTVLGALGIEVTQEVHATLAWRDFMVTAADDDHPATERLHIGFVAPSRAKVDAFWEAGVGAGYADDGAPGPRPEYSDSYYGAFLRDPDGNSAEAVHRDGLRRDGAIDHLWIRVADLGAATAFYAAIASFGHFTAQPADAGRSSFVGDRAGGSFSLVAGAPTRNLHMAFGTSDEGDVDGFHATAVAAGHRDNGGPGERPRYHPGYYGAFVLDPDGNNIEVVDHHRG